MSVPSHLASLLQGRPPIDATEQAFPFLTVDQKGFPHVALLSRAELDVSPDGSAILVVAGSPRTRANLQRDRRAGLIAVSGTTAHYAKLRVRHSLEVENLLGCSLEVVEHKEDDIGIHLEPITFQASQQVADMERWDVSERVLRTLAEPESRR